MNPIVFTLIATDFFVISALGLTAPIFAIFIERNIIGGSIATAGFAQSIYMIVKAALQPFIGRYNDRDRGNVREFWTSLFGYAIITIIPLLYTTVRTIEHLYLVQVLFGIGAACAYPGFMTIFTKFADRQREGLEWSSYSTSVFIGMAVTATIGAWAVERFGFPRVFIAASGFAAIGFVAFASLGLKYEQFRTNHHPPARHPRDVPPVK